MADGERTAVLDHEGDFKTNADAWVSLQLTEDDEESAPIAVLTDSDAFSKLDNTCNEIKATLERSNDITQLNGARVAMPVYDAMRSEMAVVRRLESFLPRVSAEPWQAPDEDDKTLKLCATVAQLAEGRPIMEDRSNYRYCTDEDGVYSQGINKALAEYQA